MSQKTCPVCNASVEDKERYCPFCFHDFFPDRDEPVQTDNEVADESSEEPQAVPVAYSGSTPESDYTPGVRDRKRRRKSGVVRFLILLIIVTFVIGMIVASVKNNSSKKATKAPASASVASVEEEPAPAEEVDTSDVIPYADQYFFPDIDRRYLEEDEVSGMDYATLRLVINEIYARHGFVFGPEDLAEHFSKCAWYVPNDTVTAESVVAELNEYETKNMKLLLKYRKLKKQ